MNRDFVRDSADTVQINHEGYDMSLKCKLTLFAIPAMVFVFTSVLGAEKPNYDLLELTVAHQQSDTTGTQTGYFGNASLDLGAGFFAEASGTHETGSSSAGDSFTDSYLGGLGYRVSFPVTDVFLSVDYLHLSSGSPTNSNGSSGYRWVWGLRGMATPSLELNTGVEKASIGNTSTGIRFGASYAFAGRVALRGQYTWSQHVKSWIVGLRVYY
jgi:hypothetical protein